MLHDTLTLTGPDVWAGEHSLSLSLAPSFLRGVMWCGGSLNVVPSIKTSTEGTFLYQIPTRYRKAAMSTKTDYPSCCAATGRVYRSCVAEERCELVSVFSRFSHNFFIR